MRRIFCAACAVFISCAISLPADAHITDLLQLFGQTVPAAPRTLKESPPRTLLLNGFALQVMSGRTPETVDSVLDFYAQRFSREAPGKAQPPMQRQRGRDFGSLVAVDAPLSETVQRMQTRKLHWALTAPLRMSYAQRVGDYTDYLAVWSEKPLPADVLRPPEATDAPGFDIPDTPRPPSSLRSFNVQEPASGYQVVTYVVDASEDLALASAVSQLQSAGYRPDPGFANAAQRKGKRLIRLERPGRDLIVSVKASKKAPSRCQITYLSRER